MDENFHRKHFLSEAAHKAVNRYVQITAQYINLFATDNMKVLDVGGSDGIMQEFVKGQIKSIDIFPASEKVSKGTIHDEPNNVYDLIIYNHVLEHIHKSYDELEKAVACLKPKGYLFIACPYYTAPWAYEPEDHIQLYNEHILRRQLESVGMTVVEYSKHCFREDKVEQWIVAQKA